MAWESVVSQKRTFAGVEISSTQGPESTQIGHSGPLMRTSAMGSQSGRLVTAIPGIVIADDRTIGLQDQYFLW
jgi:hypothetical protein